MNYNISVEFQELTLDVSIFYQLNRGVHTFSNGNPGYPDTVDCSIHAVYLSDSEQDIFDLFEKANLISQLEEACIEKL